MISLVIPTSGRWERLRLALASCHSHRPKCEELIIVLDGCSKGVPSAVREDARSLPVTWIDGPALGRASARNEGAKAATGDLLVFIDDDVLTGSDFLFAHAEAQNRAEGYVRGRMRELIGATVCDDIFQGGPGFPRLRLDDLRDRGFEAQGYRIATSTLEKAVEAYFMDGEVCFPPWLASAGPNFSITRQLWDALGGQNQQFGLDWGCEDLEFAYRVLKGGHGICFSDRAVGYHMSHPRPDRWPQHERNLKIFETLHQDPDVAALSALLGPKGGVGRYRAALGRQFRSA